MATQLSKVTPDFDSLVSALVDKLNESEAWQDSLVASYGTVLIDMIAGVGADRQFYIESAFREAFSHTATRESSVYAAARFLGIRLSRKLPASVQCFLQNTGPISRTIPPFSQFTIGSRLFFNRSQIIIPSGSTVTNINLFEGQVKTKVFNLGQIADLEFYEFALNEPGFIVSDSDVIVSVKDLSTLQTDLWLPTDSALFELTENQKIYFDYTKGNGDIVITFGDGQFGKKLPQNGELTIKYVVTEGADATKSISDSQLNISYNVEPSVIGQTTGLVIGGANQKPAIYYKLYGHIAYRARKKVITELEWKALTNLYPGVADAVVLGQRDIAPSDLSFMNVVRVCILPENSDSFGGVNPNPNSQQWSDFKSWILNKKHRALEIQSWNPTKLPVRIRLTVGIFNDADPDTVTAEVQEAINALFQKKPGILGRMLAVSDITDACKQVSGVDYVTLHEPIEDIVPTSSLEYVSLSEPPLLTVVFSKRASGNTLI